MYDRAMKTLKILIAVLLLVVGVGGGWQAARLDPDVELGASRPDVVFTDFDGASLPLSSLLGKVVLLDFWGST